MTYPRLAAYGATRSSGFPLKNADGTINGTMVAAYARYGVVTLDVNTALLHPDIVAALRAAREDIRIVGYALITHWYLDEAFVPRADDKSFNAAWHNAIKATGGFLPNPVMGYEVDWAMPETAAALTELLVTAVSSGLFDSLFLDYLVATASWAGVGNAATDSMRRDNMMRLVGAVRWAAGNESFRVYGNTHDLLGCDGTMKEGYPNTTTATFEKAIAQGEGDWLKSEGSGTGSRQVARLVLGTACLTGAFACYGTDHRVTEPWEGTFWYPEYDVKLGEALGPAQQLASGLWMRTFTLGAVLVNPGTATITKDMLRPWRTVGGNLVRNVTVASRDALFLLRERPRP